MNLHIYIWICLQYPLGHREISQLDHRENKAYTLGLSQLLVFIAVATNTDGFFSYQCIRFFFLYDQAANFLCGRAGTDSIKFNVLDM